MHDRRAASGLMVASALYDFVETEALQGVGLAPQDFWASFANLVADFGPENRRLLAERARLQDEIDEWHRADPQRAVDVEASAHFLQSIGYLEPEPDDVNVTTQGVDTEIAEIPGPQLVVPVLNARFAINAANARWGSLYDALYGTDALPEDSGRARGEEYNPVRGRAVVGYVRMLLDRLLPLVGFGHGDAVRYAVEDDELAVFAADGRRGRLVDSSSFRGYTGRESEPAELLFVHHALHLEIRLDRNGVVGSTDPAGIDDVLLESAVTTIVDFEDAVAAVDAEDKVAGYRNWKALNDGSLTERVQKDGRQFLRSMGADRRYVGRRGTEVVVPGRSLMLVRNVGLHMMTDAVLDSNGDEVPEGLLDALVTTVTALPGLNRANSLRNSRTDSIYVVKPKVHGPAEARFVARVFARVESALTLPPGTVKIGLMDEERRTTLNLAACIEALADRLVFINTGFLDRSGDEIHTAFEAGPVVRKADMRSQPWMQCYEKHNVDVGLHAGLGGKAQIGKGMWAMPDLMADMLKHKRSQVEAGASTAWVPSPTAATLHALHYHEVDVAERQRALMGQTPAETAALLQIPVSRPAGWTPEEVAEELDDNVQSILGYVVRWVDQGIGCSKVADIHGVALMEDRATLRISSQLLANWLHHGVLSADQIRDSFVRMAGVVDAQNAADPAHRPLTGDLSTREAYQAALELIFSAREQPNGYTEQILHRWRRTAKARHAVLTRERAR